MLSQSKQTAEFCQAHQKDNQDKGMLLKPPCLTFHISTIGTEMETERVGMRGTVEEPMLLALLSRLLRLALGLRRRVTMEVAGERLVRSTMEAATSRRGWLRLRLRGLPRSGQLDEAPCIEAHTRAPASKPAATPWSLGWRRKGID